jgi:hypothetical protein
MQDQAVGGDAINLSICRALLDADVIDPAGEGEHKSLRGLGW